MNTPSTQTLRAAIADDGFAMSFQTLGQYRQALLAIPAPQMSPEIQAAIAEAHKTGATSALTSSGEAVFINYGHDFGDDAHLACTACGGSGHVDDQRVELPAGAVPVPYTADMARMMIALGTRYLQENASQTSDIA